MQSPPLAVRGCLLGNLLLCLTYLQAAQEARLLSLDRQARSMRAQIAAMKEGRILSMHSAFSPADRYTRTTLGHSQSGRLQGAGAAGLVCTDAQGQNSVVDAEQLCSAT